MTTAVAEGRREDRAAVDKAISLLLSFGDGQAAELGVSELARRADLSKSTAHRVLGLLERNGVVERVGTAYRLGNQLHRLGRSVYPAAHDQIRDLLIPHVAELYERTHETVHLAAMHGVDVVYLAKLYGSRQVKSPSRIGGRVPAHCTAVGQAMMAHDGQAAALVMAGELQAWTPTTITDPAALAARLHVVRSRGVAIDDQEAQPGLSCVAGAVLGADGRPVAAMSVSVAAGRTDPRIHEQALRSVCAEATRTVARAARVRGPVPARSA
ncbi:IclR family transcriptional regulator [Klenkia sp. LSe6-5]|uniref:IclR family transcriptional regulator n=1 Tax=Klenkia sesuvii TaxID=3103137 RepID=A0ABU8DQP5_9ACTN